jgi:ribosome-associated translation inhibitor RaiA
MEASGTSGMKAALNGVPSMSILKKLETRMKHYPAGTIHLQIVLERHPRKPLFAARLTLRVPSNILRSEKSATDVIKAFDDAVKALLRELASLMADLRRETFWKRRERRKELHALKAAGILSQSQNWLSDSDRR